MKQKPYSYVWNECRPGHCFTVIHSFTQQLANYIGLSRKLNLVSPVFARPPFAAAIHLGTYQVSSSMKKGASFCRIPPLSKLESWRTWDVSASSSLSSWLPTDFLKFLFKGPCSPHFTSKLLAQLCTTLNNSLTECLTSSHDNLLN